MGYSRAILRTTISKQVVRELRRMIITRELREGEHLVEAKLANRFECSNGPIREALRVLEQEGLVQTSSGGKSVVVWFSLDDLFQLYAFRAELDRITVDLISKRELSPASYRQLEAIVTNMANSESAIGSEWDMAFHKTLLKLGGNRYVEKVADAYYDLIFELLTLANTYADFEAVIKDHQEILRLLQLKKWEDAVQALQNSSERGGKILAAKLWAKP